MISLEDWIELGLDQIKYKKYIQQENPIIVLRKVPINFRLDLIYEIKVANLNYPNVFQMEIGIMGHFLIRDRADLAIAYLILHGAAFRDETQNSIF